MNVKEFIRLLRPRINDAQATTYTDDELLRYLNDALVAIGQKLIALRDPSMIRRGEFVEGDNIPAGFAGFVGQVPIEVYDGTVHPYTPNKKATVRFYRFPSAVEAVDPMEDIDLPDKAFPQLFQMTAALTLNRNEFDITQEMGLANGFASGEAEILSGTQGARKPLGNGS